MEMNCVLKYPGAKNRIAPWIIENLPQHKIYVEPFFGSGAVFFKKELVYNNIINDVDEDIYNFFEVLRNDGMRLIEKIGMTPYSRLEYELTYSGDTECSIEKARRFAVKCWQGFGCGNKYKNGYRRGIGTTSPNPAKAWAELPVTLQMAIEKLKHAQIEHKNAVDLIADMKSTEALIYIDPPYILSTRKKNLYNHEMSDKEHEELLDVIIQSPCKIAISGYENDLYNTRLADWNKKHKKTLAECTIERTETLWMNY